MFRLLSVLLLLTISSYQSFGQIAAWNPAGLSGFGPSPWGATTIAANVTVTGLTRGPGVGTSGAAAGSAWGGTAWDGASVAGSIAGGDYATCTIKANAGYKVSLSSFQLFYRRSTTGPPNGQLQYSTDGIIFTDVPAGAFSYSSSSSTGALLPTVTLSGIAALQNVPCNITITLRLVNYGGGSGGTWYVFNSGLTVNGTVTTYPAPVITTDPSTVSIPVGSGTSFTVSGVSDAASYQWQRNTSGISGGTWVNITSPTLDPTGTYSGYTTTSTATSNTLTLSAVPASWNGYGYRCLVTNCSGTTTSGGALLNVSAAACSGTPAAGTAVPATTSFCGSGSTTLTLSGGSTGSGLTYQWSSSPTNLPPGTNIPGATSTSYITTMLTGTTYFWCTTTCTLSSLSDISSVGTVTIDPLPVVTAPGGDVCSGGSGLGITASGASTYTWAPATGLSATTGVAVTANPTSNTTYTVTGTSAAGCTGSNTLTVNYNLNPGALSVTPPSFTACTGSAPQLLVATGGLIGPTTVNSGSITIPSSIGASGTIANGLNLAGIPAGAVITGASVNVVNFGSQYQDDYIINIKAPNGNVLNLIKQRGTHTSTVTTLFANTNVSSSGVTSLASGSGTFTGTWMADAVNSVGIAPYLSNVTTWGSLFSVPNGTWTLSVFNNTAFSNTVVPSAQWSITLDYSYQAPVTWAPFTDLYTDAAATIPYTGGVAGSVYFSPTAASTVYTATATNATCTSTANATTIVNPLPAIITGATNVCVGTTSTLNNTTTGGTWSCSNANVSIGAMTGIVTGITAGTSTITYTLSTGCLRTILVSVNSLPPAITGTTQVCEGSTTTLSNTVTGGTWAGSNTNSTVNATTGVVMGVMAGTSDITYTAPTGCITTTQITINALPPAIAGATQVCQGATTTLSNAVAGGTWSSSNTNSTVNITTGAVTGNTAGTSIITYTLPTGCMGTITFTVNPLPAAITGGTSVCETATITLNNASAGGTWSTSNANASIGVTTGVLSGMAAGASVVTYTLGTGCITTLGITVNPQPPAITGATQVCVGSVTTLSNSYAGTWVSGNPSVATIGMSMGVLSGISAGTSAVTFTSTAGCTTTTTITTNPLPGTISGIAAICTGFSTTLSSSPAGGTWTSSNVNASANVSTGVVTGISVGTSLITYALPTGCRATRMVTVNGVPPAITGTLTVCAGLTTVLSNTMPGGSWSSSNVTVGTVNATTGVVSGVGPGITNITYGLGTGCSISAILTVNPVPPAITGIAAICAGNTTNLFNAVTGGTWTSSIPPIASVSATTGVVSAMISGTSTITYTLSTGCYATRVFTVNLSPSAVLGAPSVCQGRVTVFSDATPGGIWISSATSVATVGATSGWVTGMSAGTSVITYTLPSSCFATDTILVNPTPTAITGNANVCTGSTSALYNAVSGGTWSSANIISAPISASGIVSGNSTGTSMISYILPTGCYTTTVATVNTLPSAYPVTGGGNYCPGSGGANVGLGGSDTGTKYALLYSTSTLAILPGTGSVINFGGQTSIGMYSVRATILATGCERIMTGSATVGLMSAVTPTVGITPALDTFCSGVSVTFTPTPVNSGLYPLYHWRVNGIAAGVGSSFSYVPANGDVVSVKMNSSATCVTVDTAIGSRTLVVLPSVVPAVGVSVSPNDTLCGGASLATFTAAGTYSGTLPVYKWNVNGTYITTAPTFTYTPANNDIITCAMTNNYRCRLTDIVYSTPLMMVVLPTLAPTVTIDATPGFIISPAETVTLTATVTNGGLAPTYQWTINSGVVPGATTNVFISSTFNNGDAVACKVTSSGLCGGIQGSTTKFITYKPTSGIVDHPGYSNIKIAPNPNNGKFTLSGIVASNIDEEMNITITDLLGQTIYTKTIVAKNGLIKDNIETGNTLSNGMYILNINSGVGNKTIRFILEQ